MLFIQSHYGVTGELGIGIESSRKPYRTFKLWGVRHEDPDVVLPRHHASRSGSWGSES